LLALLARFGRPVLAVRVVATVALSVDEGGDDGTVLTTRRFAVLGHILLALLANGGSGCLGLLLKLRATISALDHGERAPAFLKIHNVLKVCLRKG